MHITAHDCKMVRITYGVAFVAIYLVITCSEEVSPLNVVVFPVWTHIAMSCCNRKISAFISDLSLSPPGDSEQLAHAAIQYKSLTLQLPAFFH